LGHGDPLQAAGIQPSRYQAQRQANLQLHAARSSLVRLLQTTNNLQVFPAPSEHEKHHQPRGETMYDMRIKVGSVEGVPEYRTVSVIDVLVVNSGTRKREAERNGYVKVEFPHSLLLTSMVNAYEQLGLPMMMAKLA
jgi:hypothetical protein